MCEVKGMDKILQAAWARGDHLQIARKHPRDCSNAFHLFDPRPQEQCNGHHRQRVTTATNKQNALAAVSQVCDTTLDDHPSYG